jgi:hypothetical protein
MVKKDIIELMKYSNIAQLIIWRFDEQLTKTSEEIEKYREEALIHMKDEEVYA